MVAIFVAVTIIVFLTIDYFIQKVAKHKQSATIAEASAVRFLLPRGLFFGKGHTWIELLPSGNVRIGVDDFVQKLIGKIDEIRPIPPGDSVKRGDEVFSIRQGNKTLTFRSPISGTILSINSELTKSPAFLKHDPYREGWIAVIEPKSLPEEIQIMTIGDHAAKWLKEEIRRFRSFITEGVSNEQYPELAMAGKTLMDGGVPINGALEHISKELWEGFEKEFLQQE